MLNYIRIMSCLCENTISVTFLETVIYSLSAGLMGVKYNLNALIHRSCINTQDQN